MKILCETCSRFIRYEPNDPSLKVSTEPCPYACQRPPAQKEKLSDVAFRRDPPYPVKLVGMLGH